MIREACGVIAAYSQQGVDVIPKVLRGLEALQHRGQESWGIAANGKKVFKRMGLAAQWHTFVNDLDGYGGRAGIGHVRYSTKGRSTLRNAHPLQIGRDFSIAHNGTIVNTDALVEAVNANGGKKVRRSVSDTLLAGLRLQQLLREERWNWPKALKRLGKEIAGAYSFVILTSNGEVYALRDPRGYRPLCLGFYKKTGTYVVASESCALSAVDAVFMRDVEAGEVIHLGGPKRALESFRFASRMKPAYCSFEYTYFAHPSSRINGISVYEARKRVGAVLARRFDGHADVVVPVPDSARPAALGYSVASGIPLDEGLMKDRYKKKGSIRSFIEPSQGRREEVVKQIIPIREAIEGKDVVVVDDSIVRGTSSKIIATSLRRAGAKSVKMMITFPPIRYPCYMGVDFPSREELVAFQVGKNGRSEEKIIEKIGKAIKVDELHFNDVDGLAEGIGLPRDSMCFACVNGDYSKLGTRPEFKTRKEMKE